MKPLKIAFVITSMPVGGAETLLVNLLRNMDSSRYAPEVICLKEPGPLGLEIAKEFPLHANFLRSKYDLRILPRLIMHFRRRGVQAVVTVGAGDKMFWGRLAAWIARVPVIASALHSTGWPDGVGRMNRLLTKITDAFIAVAKPHGEFLVDFEKFPPSKVVVIPNGIDTERFRAMPALRDEVREELGIPTESPIVGIVAALRPEKNHRLFVEMAQLVSAKLPQVHFIVVGEGPERGTIESEITERNLEGRVHLLGSRSDTPRLLAAMDLFALTSHNEANPVSILEALSTQVPVVATDVGSVSESVQDGITGFLSKPGDGQQFAERVVRILTDGPLAKAMGAAGRERVIATGSLHSMVVGYEQLLVGTYLSKLKKGAETPLLSESRRSPLANGRERRHPLV